MVNKQVLLKQKNQDFFFKKNNKRDFYSVFRCHVSKKLPKCNFFQIIDKKKKKSKVSSFPLTLCLPTEEIQTALEKNKNLEKQMNIIAKCFALTF